MKRVGVLAMQGAFAEHMAALRGLGVEAFPVRHPHQLADLDGLILPGGESTTIGHLMKLYGLTPVLQELANQGLPMLGTCAGIILLATKATDLGDEPVAALDIEVRRNAYGRQVDSFEADLAIPALGSQPFPGVFIRAPTIDRVGAGVEVLAQLGDGSPVAVRQGNLLGTTFHPELTTDRRFHTYFLDLLDGQGKGGGG